MVQQATGEGALSTPSGRRYDPAAPLLGALAAPPPNSPDDPLRLAIRRAAQVRLQPKPSASDRVHLPGVSLLTRHCGTVGVWHPVPALMMHVHAVV